MGVLTVLKASNWCDHLRCLRCAVLVVAVAVAAAASAAVVFDATRAFDVWLSLFYKPPRYGGYINKRRDAETPSLFELNEAVVSTTSNSPQRWSSQLAKLAIFSFNFCLFKSTHKSSI